MVDLNVLSTQEIIELYGEIVKIFWDRKIITTNNFVGELGEYLAINHYVKTNDLPNLIKDPPSNPNYDAHSENGARYNIKATSRNTTSKFHGLNRPEDDAIQEQLFEYVIIVMFNKYYQTKKIIEIHWDTFLKYKKWHKTDSAWQLVITKNLVRDSIVLYDSIE